MLVSIKWQTLSVNGEFQKKKSIILILSPTP